MRMSIISVITVALCIGVHILKGHGMQIIIGWIAAFFFAAAWANTQYQLLQYKQYVQSAGSEEVTASEEVTNVNS